MTASDSATTVTDTTAGEVVAPIRREIVVKAQVETAFALFTAHIDRWWPLGRFSVFGADAMVAFEGDRIVERLGGQESTWAEVTGWDPPNVLRLDWHPGRPESQSTDLEISFTEIDDGTLVTLVHSNWERTEDPAETAQSYGQGWPGVLAGYAAAVSTANTPSPQEPDERGESDADTKTGSWYALVHTPGSAIEDDSSIFAHPRFGEHLAFLGRLADRGMLVAAGPVFPERGEGMAVIRVLPEHGDVDIEKLVTTEDTFVAAGFLEVEVRPWSVRIIG